MSNPTPSESQAATIIKANRLLEEAAASSDPIATLDRMWSDANELDDLRLCELLEGAQLFLKAKKHNAAMAAIRKR